MAKTPRTWTGARSPSGLKRVRSSARRHEILQPRRSAAKTLVKAALTTAAGATNGDGTESSAALAAAMSALDRAAKVGAIHPNQAARRKSRLALAMNAAFGGASLVSGATAKTVSKAQAQKAAKARIAASKADKAKGAQTAAGKARAALTRTSRSESGDTASKATAAVAGTTRVPAAKPATKATSKPAAKASTKAPAAKAAATKAASTKVAAAKPAAKATSTKAAPAKPVAKAPAKKAAKS